MQFIAVNNRTIMRLSVPLFPNTNTHAHLKNKNKHEHFHVTRTVF